MDTAKEEKALSAYIKFLQGKNVSSEAIALRAKFLEKLTILLQGKSTREEYGSALETALKVEGNIERHQQLNIAREFFPFWIGDVKMIARMSETYGYDFNVNTTNVHQPAGIGNLAAAVVITYRHHDGANQLGDLHAGAYSDYTGYQPVNPPAQINDLNHWQPLRTPNGSFQGVCDASAV